MLQPLNQVHRLITGVLQVVKSDKKEQLIMRLLIMLTFCIMIYSGIKALSDVALPPFITLLYLLTWAIIICIGHRKHGLMIYATFISGITLIYSVMERMIYFYDIDIFYYILMLPFPPLSFYFYIEGPLIGFDNIHSSTTTTIIFYIIMSSWLILSIFYYRKTKEVDH